MEYRNRILEINVRSARHLKNVNYISKMDVYAIVSISGIGKPKEYRTCVDRAGGTNPTWNFPINFSIDDYESSAAAATDQNRLTLLIINLRCERALGDKDIGEIRVPIKDLHAPAAGAGEMKPQFVTYQVRKPSGSGRPRGELLFSYKWKVQETAKAKAKAMATAYPVVSSSGKYDPVITTPDDPYPAGGLYPKVEPYKYNPYTYQQQPMIHHPYPSPPPQQGYRYPVRPGYGYYPPV